MTKKEDKNMTKKEDKAEHINKEMLLYIKENIENFDTNVHAYIKRWEKISNDYFEWECFHERKYRKAMSILKELNPTIFYELLDKMDRRV